MPPTNAELTAQVEQLSADKAALEAKLQEAQEVRVDESVADVENLKAAHEAAVIENEALRAEVDKARQERDAAKEAAAGASHEASAVQQVQSHSGAVLNPMGTDSVPTVTPVAPGASDLQLDSEPCTEHFPKGWPAEEPGASISCPEGRWVYGQTPKTKPQE